MAHKLLLADDSVTIQRVIELTFADEDVQVLTAGDGEQAIARVQEDRPDIVLADIGMPKRSGYDVAAFIKGRPDLSHIPVLLLTGAFEPVDEGRAQAAGCDGVLVKPFEPQHVIARVRELLRGVQNAGLAGGSATRAVSDIPRPVERLAPHRTAEMSARPEPGALARTGGAEPAVPVRDLDFGVAPEGARSASDASLDDYFDRLDAAFANIATTTAADRTAEPVEPEALVHEPEVMPREQGPVGEKDLDWFDSPSQPSVASAQQVSPFAPTTFANPPSTFDWRAPTSVEALPSSLAAPQPPPIEPAELSPTISPVPATFAVAPTVAPPAPLPTSAPVTPRAPIAPPGSTAPGNAIADAFSALLAVEEGEPGAAPVRLTTVAPTPQVTDELIEQVTRRVIERLGPGAVKDVVADIVTRVAERLVREEIARIRKRDA
jgi:CheY-like chemotaxis protein